MQNPNPTLHPTPCIPTPFTVHMAFYAECRGQLAIPRHVGTAEGTGRFYLKVFFFLPL